MPRHTRRSFLQTTGWTIAGLGLASAASKAYGANERVNLGVVGLSRGLGLAEVFNGFDDVRIKYLCDVDQKRLALAREKIKPDEAVADLRRILDDDAVDAIVIATPDHWHAAAAILACQAGKHVYVEKPCSHNIREGRLMIDAARKHNRVMQVGTQTRSSEGMAEAVQMLREGVIGDVLVAKVINSQRRSNIGHGQECDPPEHLDFDMWLGPAPKVPYRSNYLPYFWHWWYAFGTGDMGNDGVHDIDVGLWGLGVETHPSRVTGCGTKLYFDDDQQFPDTQYIACEFPGDGRFGSKRMLVFEQRIWSAYRQEGIENGNVFYGTKGVMLAGKKDGYQVFGEGNKLLKERKFDMPSREHQRNFIDAIRSNQPLNADIEIGHRAATVVHLGNIVARLGRGLDFDPAAEQIAGDDEANALTRREYRPGHWAAPA